MAVEQKRKCGYRKAGGVYAVGELVDVKPKPMFPFCTDRVQNRGLTVDSGKAVFEYALGDEAEPYRTLERVGLVWIGEKYYDPKSFTEEALLQGVSKRLPELPKDLKPGDTIVVAYRAAIATVAADVADGSAGRVADHCQRCAEVPTAKAMANGMTRVGTAAMRAHIASVSKQLAKKLKALPQHPYHEVAGVFAQLTYQGIELVLPQSWADKAWVVKECLARGVTIVAVPDDDTDHVQPGWEPPRWLKEPSQQPLDFPADEPAGQPEALAASAEQEN